MPRILVTGAFSNIGAAVAERLGNAGADVLTLTNREPSGPLSAIEARALRFEQGHLTEALRGVDVLVNTYWVRTPSHGAGFGEAIDNSRLLIDAALDAGVRRLVNVSVLHAAAVSPSPYYAGKGVIDDYIRERFDDHAIVQPSLVVGPKDVLTSNMAWFVRRMPLIPAPDGDMQPVLLDDLGRIVADAVLADGPTRLTIEAAGHERYTFRSYLELLAAAAGLRRRIVPAPRPVFAAATWVAGKVVRDDLVTRDELQSLASGYLVPAGEATCPGSVSDWLHENIGLLGHRYVNDSAIRRRSAALARSA